MVHPRPGVAVFGRIPVPGRCKTRLSPVHSPARAAALYAAMLADVLRAAARLEPAAEVRFVADGAEVPGRYLGVPARPQPSGGLADRLEDVFRHRPGPMLLVATDVPQVRTGQLRRALRTLTRPGGAPRAVLGPTHDGGFWCLGLNGPDPGFLHDVDFTSPSCTAAVVARLRRDGVAASMLPAVLRDIDDDADARSVAARHPRLGFSAAMRGPGRSLGP